ncbi:MAG: DUF1998 domain-containing protein [Sphingobacteriia bacterium]|nr:DUF1998 domain-containing protein [Sphingobacteriia bacterium]
MPAKRQMGSGSFYPKRPIRRGQLLGPWGVGAIVPFPNDESLMIAGLDMWEYKNPDDFIIKEERLIKRLKVKELRRPPDYRDPKSDRENALVKIPAVRFPLWHYCPYCGAMEQVNYFTSGNLYCRKPKWPNGRNCSDKNITRRLIPERFIIVCPEGHIDDFPIAEWVHEFHSHKYSPETCRIRRSTGGLSTSLSGVKYECTCGARRNMATATAPGALNNIYKCSGAQPWLGISGDQEHPCGNQGIRVVQRGGTNVWFADIVSSIYIPAFSTTVNDEKINRIVDEYMAINYFSYVNGKLDIPKISTDRISEIRRVDPDTLFNAFLKRVAGKDLVDHLNSEISENDYRLTEFNVLCNGYKDDDEEFISNNLKISNYDGSLSSFFGSVSLVPVLKETRALVGFSRLEPSIDISYGDKMKVLRRGTGDWLPANDTFGEGIFIEFDKNALATWKNNPEVVNRVKTLEKHFTSKYVKVYHGDSGLNPAFVLLHTFAHILINQLAYECGYGSSSIRERIYCTRGNEAIEMNGILIYTASGDSEGTLGGLVKQGEPGRLENTIYAAVENALWCSSDPICIESKGQGPDSCNLAACHNCSLLPETCCETGNRLLDRALLIGAQTGFFNKIFDNTGD